MAYLFLCIFLIGTAHGVSLFDLEVKYNGIKTIVEKDQETIKQLNAEIAKLKKDQETSRQLKSEISELKKELVNSQQRSGSLNSIEELIEKLAVVSSNLDMLKSGQETEKIERHGILADLGQIKQWTTNLIAKTEQGWTNVLAKFTTENRDKQSDYEEFKKQASDEWDQWRDETNGTLSGIEAGCEETKSYFQIHQTQLGSRIGDLEKSFNCFKDCETGWLKDGCSCFSSLNNLPRLTYNAAINKCAESGARLIEPREITEDRLNKKDVWLGVTKYSRYQWRYPNGTEARGLNIAEDLNGRERCLVAALLPWEEIVFFAKNCAALFYVICVKS